MDNVRKCGNCKYRLYNSWGGILESCYGYENSLNENEEILWASECKKYEKGIPSCLDDEYDDYTPSATRGDYSPSCPWNAPGMSIRDFI